MENGAFLFVFFYFVGLGIVQKYLIPVQIPRVVKTIVKCGKKSQTYNLSLNESSENILTIITLYNIIISNIIIIATTTTEE